VLSLIYSLTFTITGLYVGKPGSMLTTYGSDGDGLKMNNTKILHFARQCLTSI